MESSTFTFSDLSGNTLFARKWMPDSQKPGAIVQIIHGLAEHSERYTHFAKFLTDLGYGVMAYDHRGHGETDPNQLGHIPNEDGFHRMTKNILDFSNVIKEEYPDLPKILFAHSMGSFLTQRYMQLFDDRPAGIIYSGSNGKPPVHLPAGIALSSVISKIYGPDYKSEFIHYITFKPYNDHFKPNRTVADWLSRDNQTVNSYIRDPKCGFIPSASFYNHFYRGLKTLHNHTPFASHDRDIPILVISGTQDPVSNMGKGIKNLVKILRGDGVSDLTVKLYDGARHELLNEINRDEVMDDIKEWISRL